MPPVRHETPEARKEYDKKRQRRLRELNGVGTFGKPFVAVDGEGGKDENGRHQYYLLTAGKYTLHTGKPLTPNECFEFLSRLPTDVIYVGYFFDYDVTMMCKDMRPGRVEHLLRDDRKIVLPTGREIPLPVDYDGFQIDYRAHKEFKVRKNIPAVNPGGSMTHSPFVVINDVGSFFQCPFITAIRRWGIGTEVEQEMIADGKDKRATFTHLEEDTIIYNALEIRLIAELMEAYRQACITIGYMPRRWQGPGYLATSMLSAHDIPQKKNLNIPDDVRLAANSAYYGGRFETTAVGQIPGPIYHYDINSAYPDALRKLPCLIHGTWENIRAEDARGRLYLAHGVYTASERANLYNFECRDKYGRITCPENGEGWYWSVEIEGAAHQTFEADTVYALNVHCDCVPFDWVPEVYQARLDMGKQTKGIVLKLGMNSMYGKTCQSIGGAPYANPIYAGLITALTRTKLMGICHDGKADCRCNRVYMLATDAVFTTDNLGIEGDKILGGWDLEVHESMFIVMAGIYFTGIGASPKTRGIPQNLVIKAEPALREVYKDQVTKIRAGFDPATCIADMKIMVPLVQFVGIKLAFARHKPESAGQWVLVGKNHEGRAINFNWSSKREADNFRVVRLNPEKDDWTILTSPYGGYGVTVPYDKDIGLWNEFREEREEERYQPDWAPSMFNSEG